MEFDELTKIWDSQNNKLMFAIDESALHRRIQTKKRQARSITNISELLLIIVNICSGTFVIIINVRDGKPNIFLTLLSIWMFCTTFYSLLKRIKRINGDRRFDQSMQGDLDHALSTATYQVRLSQIMRWNILPVALLLIVASMNKGQSFWIQLIFFVFFGMAVYASGWEVSIYKSRRKELETLKRKLANG